MDESNSDQVGVMPTPPDETVQFAREKEAPSDPAKIHLPVADESDVTVSPPVKSLYKELGPDTGPSANELASSGEKKGRHIVIDFDESEKPPEFTPYEAEFFETDDGDIISHDHHLNHDGEALYRFLLSHAATYPPYNVYVGGTHQELRSRMVTRTINGRQETRMETYTVTISDFNFCIDLANHIVTGPVHWSFADTEPAYRGLMVRQVQAPEGRRKATTMEKDDFKAWEKERIARGLPPWAGRDGRDEINVLQSSQTLRQWADEYCASPKYLKEFAYEKFVHGWNMQALEEAIRGAIMQTQYRGDVVVHFRLTGTKICIRSDNKLSRTLSNKFYFYLLCIFLIYPFIWLFKRYHSRGGGRWEVCGGAYSLKHLEPVGSECPLAEGDISHPERRPLNPRIIETDSGPARLIGLREGEWFKRWEETIKRAVVTGMRDSKPMMDIGDGPIDAARQLDGY